MVTYAVVKLNDGTVQTLIVRYVDGLGFITVSDHKELDGIKVIHDGRLFQEVPR